MFVISENRLDATIEYAAVKMREAIRIGYSIEERAWWKGYKKCAEELLEQLRNEQNEGGNPGNGKPS